MGFSIAMPSLHAANCGAAVSATSWKDVAGGQQKGVPLIDLSWRLGFMKVLELGTLL